jgi:hypothetical protein
MCWLEAISQGQSISSITSTIDIYYTIANILGDKIERYGIDGDVIMEIDWSVSQILDAFKNNGIEDNTLIIYASDNGPWLNYGKWGGSADPLREGKGTMW